MLHPISVYLDSTNIFRSINLRQKKQIVGTRLFSSWLTNCLDCFLRTIFKWAQRSFSYTLHSSRKTENGKLIQLIRVSKGWISNGKELIKFSTLIVLCERTSSE